jgi:DNA integrity scanning protein DisA with diadenylate cyclase activity
MNPEELKAYIAKNKESDKVIGGGFDIDTACSQLRSYDLVR